MLKLRKSLKGVFLRSVVYHNALKRKKTTMLTRRATLAAAPLAALGLTLSTPPSTALTTYSDVKPGTLFYTEMTWAINKALLPGYPDGTFRPDAIIDRQTFARIIYIYRGKPTYTPPIKSPFTDVPTTHPYYKEITWLITQGVTTGYWDKTFRPTHAVERNTFAVFLYRMAGEPYYIPPVTSYFVDTPPTTEFYKEICWLHDMKITTGWNDGTYKPLEPIERYAVCAFLYRYHQIFGY